MKVLSWVPNLARKWEKARTECAYRSCHNTQFVRSLPGGRAGIRVAQHWYCSVDCFSLDSRNPLEILMSRRVAEFPRQPRLSLGLFLVSRGLLNTEQYRALAEKSAGSDDDLAAELVRLELATERQIATARSAQWGYPLLASDYVGRRVEAEIPQRLLRTYRAVPMEYSPAAGRIVLGFAARVEHRLLASLERITGLRVEPCFITATEFDEQSDRIHPPANYEEIVIDDPGPSDKMARTLGRVAVRIGAREAVFERFREHILVRLDGKRGKADVEFQTGPYLAPEIHRESDFIQVGAAIPG